MYLQNRPKMGQIQAQIQVKTWELNTYDDCFVYVYVTILPPISFSMIYGMVWGGLFYGRVPVRAYVLHIRL